MEANRHLGKLAQDFTHPRLLTQPFFKQKTGISSAQITPSIVLAIMATILASNTVLGARHASVQAKRPNASRAVLGAPAFSAGAALSNRQQTFQAVR